VQLFISDYIINLLYVLCLGNKRFNNRKRPRFNGEFTEPIEEPMNGNLKRFAGIVGNLFYIYKPCINN